MWSRLFPQILTQGVIHNMGKIINENIIQIKDKQISIIEADCPDKTCVNMGILKSAFTPIVCLPNHLVIQYVNDDKEIDAMIN